MSPIGCPERDELRAFSTGTLAEDRAAAVAGHLGDCGTCREAIQTIGDADDTLVAQLRQPKPPAAYAGEPQQRSALDRARAIASPPASAGPAPAAERPFDPYYHWLGIAPENQPPDHYRLLGISKLEEDPVVIASAAEQRITHLRTFQLGKHGAWSQKLLNQVAAAKVCLLDAKRKADYDRRLREKHGSDAAGGGDARAADCSGAPGGAPSLTVPGRFGEYELTEKLGEGGMGVVFKAVHTKLGRTVALKVLPEERLRSAEAVARFEREMRAIGAVDHPNIVQAHDAREIGSMRVLVMEYVEGEDLSRVVQQRGPLPVAAACELVRQAAVGLQCVHEQGLVHRDIKPSNLMLSRQGQVKILDLGLARFQAEPAVGEEVTGTGQTMGTLDYMAPEQFSDARSVDIRADIYSLGCTLYKLLAGKAPFSGPEHSRPLDKLLAHSKQPVPPIGQVRSDVPGVLALVLSRMLAKQPPERYGSPAEVAAALEPFCTGSDLPALLSKADGKPPVRPPKPAGRAAPALAAALSAIDTRPRPRRAREPLAATLVAYARNRPVATVATAAALLFLLLLGVVIRIRHRDGRETVIRPEDAKEVIVEFGKEPPAKQPSVKRDPTKQGWTTPTGAQAPVRPHKTLAGQTGVVYDVDPEGGADSSVTDPEGNLKGDRSRRFMDITRASVRRVEGRYVLSVETAAPFPKPAEMAGGKRVDFVFFIDLDRDAKTGISRVGNDLNIHLHLSEQGWGGGFQSRSELMQGPDAKRRRKAEFVIQSEGHRASISFPVDYLPVDRFRWCVHSMTRNARDWPPTTSNPPTPLRAFPPTEGGADRALHERIKAADLEADRKAVEAWCAACRRIWQERKPSKFAEMTWKDQAVFVGSGTEEDGPTAPVATWSELDHDLDARAPAEVEVGTEPPAYAIQGPVAVIQWSSARLRFTEDTDWVTSRALEVLVRREGLWRVLGSATGDWRMTSRDRFEPDRAEHQAIQAVFETINRAWVERKPQSLQAVLHPRMRFVGVDDAGSVEPLVGDAETVIEGVTQMIAASPRARHLHRIEWLRVNGPIAVVLSRIEDVVEGRALPERRCLTVMARDDKGWKIALSVPGDWKAVLVDR